MTTPTLNRFAVILVPTETALEWVQSCCPDEPAPTGAVAEPTVYLIPEAEGESQAYIRRHYQAMFEEELNSWITDPELWPKDRSFDTFQKFFTVMVSTIVHDLGKGKLVRE